MGQPITANKVIRIKLHTLLNTYQPVRSR